MNVDLVEPPVVDYIMHPWQAKAQAEQKQKKQMEAEQKKKQRQVGDW